MPTIARFPEFSPCTPTGGAVRMSQRHSTMAVQAKLHVVRGGGEPGGEALTDQDILAGLEAHEGWAAAVLYDRLESVVERTLCRVLQQRGSDFEDLLQVTFE